MNRQNSNKGKKGNCLTGIEEIQRRREERRQKMGDKKAEKRRSDSKQGGVGRNVDVDFLRMIRGYRSTIDGQSQPHKNPGENRICIAVRKRPINRKEASREELDSVTCFNPIVAVHDCKLKVDGITKYLNNTDFEMDHTFDENSTTEEVYLYTAQPLVEFVFRRGRATCFAYGQV